MYKRQKNTAEYRRKPYDCRFFENHGIFFVNNARSRHFSVYKKADNWYYFSASGKKPLLAGNGRLDQKEVYE